MSRRTTVTVVPSAARLVTALRDVGYDFVGAVADLIDNSIAARATEVEITARFDGEDSWVRIADNGHGMDGGQLTEALRFGSEREYEADDLGKFGLGLKTASLSQCRRISVASRISATSARIEARVLDLDRMEKDDLWEIEVLRAAERPDNLVSPLRRGRGTVVLWEFLDRVLPYRQVGGERARQGLYDHLERLDRHLAMVFHRFLDGEVRRHPRLHLRVNDNVVDAWDPFARHEHHTEQLMEHDFDVAHRGGAGVVRLQPFVLPTKEEFSSTSEFDRFGRGQWNQSQGLWIYRANRLIQAGGWSRLRAADEHTKFARAALDFFPELDPAFGLNIAKMRVNLPPPVREALKSPVEALCRRAKQRYSPRPPQARRGRVAPGPSLPRTVAPKEKPSADALLSDSTGVSQLGRPALPGGRGGVVPVRSALEAAADAVDEKVALGRIARRLADDAPEVARALGW